MEAPKLYTFRHSSPKSAQISTSASSSCNELHTNCFKQRGSHLSHCGLVAFHPNLDELFFAKENVSHFAAENFNKFGKICLIFGDFWGKFQTWISICVAPERPLVARISLRCSPNTSPPNAKIRFPIPALGKFPGRFPQKSHFYNGMPISRPFLY